MARTRSRLASECIRVTASGAVCQHSTTNANRDCGRHRNERFRTIEPLPDVDALIHCDGELCSQRATHLETEESASRDLFHSHLCDFHASQLGYLELLDEPDPDGTTDTPTFDAAAEESKREYIAKTLEFYGMDGRDTRSTLAQTAQTLHEFGDELAYDNDMQDLASLALIAAAALQGFWKAAESHLKIER